MFLASELWNIIYSEWPFCWFFDCGLAVNALERSSKVWGVVHIKEWNVTWHNRLHVWMHADWLLSPFWKFQDLFIEWGGVV